MIALLFAAFIVLMLCGTPVGVALLVSVVLAVAVTGADMPVAVVSQQMYGGIDSFALIAIPGFLFAGELMARGVMARRLVEVAAALVGHVRGGLVIVGVLATTLFSGVSGSAVANTAAVGGVLVPQMRRRGYDPAFAGAVVANAGVLGSVFPPSIPLVLYGITAGVSISALFLAGVLPGLVIVVLLIAVGYWRARQLGYPAEPRVGPRELVRRVGRSMWALLMPVILLGGILSGIVTVTEAAVLTVLYALVVELVVYRELKPRDLGPVITRTVMTTGVVMLIIAASTLFGWLLTVERAPAAMAAAMLGVTDSVVLQLLFINVLLLVIGLFLDVAPGIIVAVPILVPLTGELGIDPVHFGIIVVVNLLIGLVTPPVAPTLTVGAAIAGVSLDAITAASWRFFASLVVALGLITYVPWLSTWLPGVVL